MTVRVAAVAAIAGALVATPLAAQRGRGQAPAVPPRAAAPVDLTGEVTAVRDSVRRIRVTIIASDPRTFAGPGTTGPQTYTLIEDIRVRNKN